MSSNESPKDLPTGAVLALNEGRLNDALRLYREAHRVGPQEARDAIDRYLELHPPLRERIRSQRARSRRRVLSWLVAVLGAGLVLALTLLQQH